MKYALHLFSIFFLVLVLVLVLFFSNSGIFVKVNYNFEENIEVKILDNNQKISLGEVVVENVGFLDSKVKLDRHVLCQISDYYGNEKYFIDYVNSGDVLKYNNNDFSSYSRYGRFSIEVGSNDKEEIKMFFGLNSVLILGEINKYNLNNKVLDLYLFEVGDDYVRYDFCDFVDKEDAVKIIHFNINLDENLIDESKNNPEIIIE